MMLHTARCEENRNRVSGAFELFRAKEHYTYADPILMAAPPSIHTRTHRNIVAPGMEAANIPIDGSGLSTQTKFAAVLKTYPYTL